MTFKGYSFSILCLGYGVFDDDSAILISSSTPLSQLNHRMHMTAAFSGVTGMTVSPSHPSPGNEWKTKVSSVCSRGFPLILHVLLVTHVTEAKFNIRYGFSGPAILTFILPNSNDFK